uniref:Mis18 domain-containing protein n=1 Tax=Stegastes partitus TaxID=144197 RepID=A0A3B4ZLU7_9TELE
MFNCYTKNNLAVYGNVSHYTTRWQWYDVFKQHRDDVKPEEETNYFTINCSNFILITLTDDTQLSSGAELTTRMTLHCQQCNRVLADSFCICGEIKCMDSIVCLSKLLRSVCLLFLLLFTCSIYSSLECRGCRSAVGKVVHSAPSRLAVIRSIFLLYKANISCYILNSSSMVKASTLTFDMKPLRKNIDELAYLSPVYASSWIYFTLNIHDLHVSEHCCDT